MKILQIIDTLNIGGAEKMCLELNTMLLDTGHQADCMVISSKGQLYDMIDKRSKVIYLERKNKYNLFKMRECAHHTINYDIVHVHQRHTWVYVKLSCIIFKGSKKLVFHDHYGDIAINKKPTFRLKNLFKPQTYIGVSQELTEWAKTELKINQSSVFLLRNTIIPCYRYSDKYKGDWVMVSNLRQTKNILLGIRMATLMKRRLVIFGNSDGSEYADSIIIAASKTEFVKIVHNETNIQQYLNNFKLAIHTSLSETGPLVLLEYMAHGLPFITSDCGEVVNQIREELPDFIVSSFNEQEWVEKIELLEYEMEVNREMVSKKLKNLFYMKFSPKTYIEKCLQIYQNVLNS